MTLMDVTTAYVPLLIVAANATTTHSQIAGAVRLEDLELRLPTSERPRPTLSLFHRDGAGHDGYGRAGAGVR